MPGIVTGVRSAGSSKGYWIQDPDPDSNPATSEGLFVFAGSAPTVHAGDSVLVSGKVADFYPLSSGDTVATTSNLSVTEIDQTGVSVLSSGNPLPAPIVLGPDTVPAAYAPDLGGQNIETTQITPSRSALDFYESIEGVRVEVDNARVVGPSDTFGEEYITTKPAQNASFRGGTLLEGENATPSGRLEIVAADGSNPEVNVGDVFSGATIGSLDYSQFGGYFIAATTLGGVQRNNLAPTVATGPAKQLSIATYNVENLAPADPASKFQALADGVVHNLADPDIIAVEEVQDNDGATDDGVVAADQTITKLTAAITAAGGPSYSSREIDPVNDQDGGQPGGNIRVVFLFNPAVVSFLDTGGADVDRSTTGTQVVKKKGEPALTLSPGRLDPANPVQRSGQALAEHRFVSQILAIDKKADVVVVGDLNDYQFSPALSVLKTGTSDGTGTTTLTDLITTLPQDEQYTYDFDGVSEVLDHILVSNGIQKFTYQVVHLNSEYANQVSDHDPQVVDIKP